MIFLNLLAIQVPKAYYICHLFSYCFKDVWSIKSIT